MAKVQALVYTRVSSDRDGGGRSVTEQEAECRAECDRRGWTVTEVLTDNSYSATRWAKRERPEFARLAGILAGGGVDVLVYWEASRTQRDLAAYVALRDLCAENGVQWCYSGRLYDLSDDDDRFSTGIDALVGEREAGLTRKRIIRAVEARAARGGVHGKLPDGYKLVYDPNTGKVSRRALDPERAPIIRELAERLLAGESAFSVAADLNERGLTSRTGKPWTGPNVIKRLSMPALCGRRVHRGEVLDGVVGEWPPLLSEEEFDRLQFMFSDPRRKTVRNGTRVRHQGSGIYVCGVCGGPLYVVSRGNGRGSPAYSCRQRFCVRRVVELVDARVDDVVVRYLSRPGVAEELQGSQNDDGVRAAKAEAASLRAKLAEAREKARTGAISLDDFALFRASWEADLVDAELRARPKWVPEAVWDVAGEHAAKRWADLAIDRKRRVLQALFEVKVMPQEVRNGTFDPAAIVVTRR